MSKIETKMRERYEQRAERDVDKPRKYRAGAKYQEPKIAPPPSAKGAYKVVLIRHAGSIKTWHANRAPDTVKMLEIGKRLGALFVIRYWPSRKGWRLLDARKAQCFQNQNMKYAQWTGHRYLSTIFPDEDSAVMAAIALSAA